MRSFSPVSACEEFGEGEMQGKKMMMISYNVLLGNGGERWRYNLRVLEDLVDKTRTNCFVILELYDWVNLIDCLKSDFRTSLLHAQPLDTS
jgi:hypothetical protein